MESDVTQTLDEVARNWLKTNIEQQIQENSTSLEEARRHLLGLANARQAYNYDFDPKMIIAYLNRHISTCEHNIQAMKANLDELNLYRP